MAVSVLRLPPAPEQVRTARLVAVAAGRRVGLDEETIDDVRLAVGEAAARAVLRHVRARVDQPVVVTFEDAPDRFVVDVVDVVDSAADDSVAGGSAGGSVGRPEDGDEDGDDDDALALALVEGLADSVEVSAGSHGRRLRLVWAVPGP